MKIFFDDSRIIPKTYTGIRTYKQLQQVVLDHEIDILSLDHDLGPDQPNMYQLLHQLIDQKPEFFKNIHEIRLHTNNIIGGNNMYHLLSNAQKAGVINSQMKINSTIYQAIEQKLVTTTFVWY